MGWCQVSFYYNNLCLSFPLMQTDNHIPLKDNGWHNRPLSLCSKSQASISIPEHQIDYLSAMETVTKDLSQASQEAKRSNDLHKGGKLRAEWLTRPWKVDTFITMTAARCLAERRTGHHRELFLPFILHPKINILSFTHPRVLPTVSCMTLSKEIL